MAKAQETTESLSIRCPSCRQRFSLGAELMNRMVECGACEARFRINDDVIVSTKKFYPGERVTPDLNSFQQIPPSSVAPGNFQTMRDAGYNQYNILDPSSPQRTMAGIVGIGLMLVVALMFIFSSDAGGSLSAMPLENKLMMGGFVSILGVALLVYANPKARAKAGIIGLLLAAGLLTIPFFIKSAAVLPSDPSNSSDYVKPIESLLSPKNEEDTLTALKDRFATNPLETEQKRLEASGSNNNAYGIYLTNLLPRNIYTVRDYLIRDSLAGPSSHPYPRNNDNYLMVLTDVPKDITEVAEIAGLLGKTEEIHPEIGVIVVNVNNEQFESSSIEKLNNPKDPAFYALNLRELSSIDIERVKLAVERLAASEPSIYREDISRMLLKHMTNPRIRFHDELSKALLVWLNDPSVAGKTALKALQDRITAGEQVPESLVMLLLKGKIPEAIPFVHKLWLVEHTIWERHYTDFGSVIEPSVLEQLNSENTPLRRSAIKILGQIGTSRSLPALGQLAADKDPEIRVLAARSARSIKGR